MLKRPPDWRIPAVVIGVVIALVVVALLIALVSLSIQANHP
jgi:predicted membrane-bound dolichyl-phosphate-mannose-protein mannosyltransferase